MTRSASSPAWRLPAFWSDTSDISTSLPWAISVLRRYFAPSPEGGYAYSGARFESLAGGGDRAEIADQFTADDLVAVSTLQVHVPGHAAIRILETDHDEVCALLANVPTDLDLTDSSAEPHITAGADAEQLWTLLRRPPGTGRTTTSKLLARKRPRLLPVYDSVIAEQLGFRDTLNHWVGTRSLLLSDPAHADYLATARAEAELDAHISLLRTFDVLVWISSPRRCPPPV